MAIVDSKEEASEITVYYIWTPLELSFWTDGSRPENSKVGAGVAWQGDNRGWRTHEVGMGIIAENLMRSYTVLNKLSL